MKMKRILGILAAAIIVAVGLAITIPWLISEWRLLLGIITIIAVALGTWTMWQWWQNRPAPAPSTAIPGTTPATTTPDTPFIAGLKKTGCIALAAVLINLVVALARPDWFAVAIREPGYWLFWSSIFLFPVLGKVKVAGTIVYIVIFAALIGGFGMTVKAFWPVSPPAPRETIVEVPAGDGVYPSGLVFWPGDTILYQAGRPVQVLAAGKPLTIPAGRWQTTGKKASVPPPYEIQFLKGTAPAQVEVTITPGRGEK